jgi:cobalt/nickel transport system permease protein
MGANIFNMGILTAAIGFGLYRLVVNQNKGTRFVVAGVAAWVSTMAAALLTSFQLWLSGTSRLEIVLPAMLGVHALIGLGEGLITAAALAFIEQTRPDLLSAEKTTASGGKGWIYAGIIIALLAVLISPLASGNPDGLERVAEDMGFLESGIDAPYQILPDYTIPFLGETGISTIIAGLVGALILFGILLLVGRSLRGSSKA